MGTAFSQVDAMLMQKFYRTHTIYTFGPKNLATGLTPVFSSQQWTPESNPEWQAELVAIWVTQNAGVQIYWTADGVSYNQGADRGFTDAAPGGLRRLPINARAIKQLTLTLANVSGAVVNGFQLNYEVVVRRLTVADKILLGYPLGPDDELVLALLGGGQSPSNTAAVTSGKEKLMASVERGTSPIPYKAQEDRTLDNMLIGDHQSSGLYHITASPNTAGTAFATLTAARGEFIALRAIGIPSANAFSLFVDRGPDLGLLTVTGAAFAQTNSQPWATTVFTTDRFQLRAYAAATLENIPVFVDVKRYKLSNIWKVRFGEAKTPQSVPGDTYAKVLAGWV